MDICPKKMKSNPNQYRIDEAVTRFLEEAGAVYSTSPGIRFSDFLSDRMLLIRAIRAGIPFSLFELIRDLLPLSDADWSDVLDISTKSLQRYKATSGFHFRPIHSEKILEMAEAAQAGLEVFGSQQKLNAWLHAPSFALGGMAPLELLKDSYGKELVMAELTRINHGILA